MAKSIAACQQPEGYWTRSLINTEQAPGPETSGTALFTYGFLWGINGLLNADIYSPIVRKGLELSLKQQHCKLMEKSDIFNLSEKKQYRAGGGC